MSFTGNLKKWLDVEHYLGDQTETQALPYELRHSNRAKRLQIRVLPTGRVEVVVPRGCSERRAHQFARERADWVAGALKKVAEKQQQRKVNTAFPETLTFPAIGEQWKITREPDNHPNQVSLRIEGETLILSGATRDDELCVSLLKRWLKYKGEDALIPWLERVSREVKLPFNKASVRGQKTRWGSCSSKKNISLNYKLLFVNPEEVRYLFIHELSHTRHMNHSRAFWAQVEKHEPDYKRLDKSLNRATHERVPGWLHT